MSFDELKDKFNEFKDISRADANNIILDFTKRCWVESGMTPALLSHIFDTDAFTDNRPEDPRAELLFNMLKMGLKEAFNKWKQSIKEEIIQELSLGAPASSDAMEILKDNELFNAISRRAAMSHQELVDFHCERRHLNAESYSKLQAFGDDDEPDTFAYRLPPHINIELDE